MAAETSGEAACLVGTIYRALDMPSARLVLGATRAEFEPKLSKIIVAEKGKLVRRSHAASWGKSILAE